MGPVGTRPPSSASTGVTKSELTKIDSVVESNGTVIPLYSTNSQFSINSIPGRGSVYGIDPIDIPKFLTLNQSYGNGTTNIGVNEVLVGADIADNFNLKVGDRIRIGSLSSSSLPEFALPGSLIPGEPLLMASQRTTGSLCAVNGTLTSMAGKISGPR